MTATETKTLRHARRGSASNVQSTLRRVFATSRRRLLHRDLRDVLPRVVHGPRVVSMGAGFDPYGGLIPDTVDYLRLDVEVYDTFTDLVADGMVLPFPDNCVDSIVAFEVLEHVLEPQRFIDECYRVLAPDGVFILSTPFLYPIHGANGDYWRFTKEGLEYLLRHFHDSDVAEHGGLLAVILDVISFSNVRVARAIRGVSGISLLGRSIGTPSRAPVGYRVVATKKATGVLRTLAEMQS